MGDHLARIIFRDFSSTSPPIPGLSIYDERFSITLSATIEAFFNIYELGLRFVSVNRYECHVFGAEIPGRVLTIAREYNKDEVPMSAALHGRTAGPPHPELANIPPPGLIRWHYQCVLKNFAHADYKTLPNIKFHEMSLRMKGDSDDEGTDCDAEWPSAALDRGRAVQASIEDNEQRHRAIADWIKKL